MNKIGSKKLVLSNKAKEAIIGIKSNLVLRELDNTNFNLEDLFEEEFLLEYYDAMIKFYDVQCKLTEIVALQFFEGENYECI